MAKEEESTPPPFIDYSGASTSGDTWTGVDVTDEYKRQLVRRTCVSIEISSIKERKLAKRIAEEYTPDMIQQMITWWIKNGGNRMANFTHFYMQRHEIAQKLAPKDYTWE